MGERAGRGRVTTGGVRGLAAAALTAGVLLIGTPALAAPLLDAPRPAADAAADPGPVAAPYGGALEAPDQPGEFDDERVLEVAMLGLGSVNGLAFAAVVIVSRFRGSSVAETRRALMARTSRGVPSGPRAPLRRPASRVRSHRS
jgi:hypothetical protein